MTPEQEERLVVAAEDIAKAFTSMAQSLCNAYPLKIHGPKVTKVSVANYVRETGPALDWGDKEIPQGTQQAGTEVKTPRLNTGTRNRKRG